MIDLKYNRWEDISLHKYDEICEAIDSEGDELTRNVGVLSILCDCDEDDIWRMPLPVVKNLMGKVKWLDKFEFDTKVRFGTVKIGDWVLGCEWNLNNFTLAQYIDFQSYWKHRNDRKAELASVFLIPKGKTYGEGYNVQELIRDLYDNLSIVTYNQLLAFFLNCWVSYTHGMKRYLGVWTKIMKWRNRKKEITKNPYYREIMERMEEFTIG